MCLTSTTFHSLNEQVKDVDHSSRPRKSCSPISLSSKSASSQCPLRSQPVIAALKHTTLGCRRCWGLTPHPPLDVDASKQATPGSKPSVQNTKKGRKVRKVETEVKTEITLTFHSSKIYPKKKKLETRYMPFKRESASCQAEAFQEGKGNDSICDTPQAVQKHRTAPFY